MTLWLVLAAMTALTVALLVRPLLRDGRPAAPRDAYDRAIYRDQLAELKREAARGLIGAEEALAAEREIARRLLAAAPAHATAAVRPEAGRTLRRWATFGIIALVPLGSLALYLAVGAPGVPDFPLARRAAVMRAQGMPDLPTAMARIEAHLKDHPEDLEGWLLLARSDAALQRFDRAAEAYRKAMDLSGRRPDLVSSYAEMTVMAQGGHVSPEMRKLFEEAHAKDAREPRARFYIGLAKSQAGDGPGALRDWLALAADSPKDAPYLQALRAQIERTATEFKLDAGEFEPGKLGPAPATPGRTPPATAPGPGGSGPSDAEIAAAQAMTPAERAQMVRGMVGRLAARLAETPDDLAGWRRLGRAYTVLGEHDKAADALGHAAKLAPQDPDVLVDYGEALAAAAPADHPPAAAVAAMRQALAIDPQRREALWYVGLDEAARGNKTQAGTLWRRLLAQLKPGSPEYGTVKQRLEALGLPP